MSRYGLEDETGRTIGLVKDRFNYQTNFYQCPVTGETFWDKVPPVRSNEHRGSRYGRWTVLGFFDRLAGGPRWLCICDCGKIQPVMIGGVRAGGSRSCGCKNSERMRAEGAARKQRNRERVSDLEAVIMNWFKRTQRNAAGRGYEFSLTIEQFEELVQQPCDFCGDIGALRFTSKKSDSCARSAVINGIDRIDNSVGYVMSNCRPCCKACNLAKHTRTDSEFREWAERLILHSLADRSEFRQTLRKELSAYPDE